MTRQYIYPTASNVEVYLNGYLIEEAFRFDYRETAPKVPIQGYNEYQYDKVAFGKHLIQGLLVTNFVFPGYLNAAIDKRTQGVTRPSKYANDDVFAGNPDLARAEDARRLEKEIRESYPPSLEGAEDFREAKANFIVNALKEAEQRIAESEARTGKKANNSVKNALRNVFFGDSTDEQIDNFLRTETSRKDAPLSFKTDLNKSQKKSLLSPLVEDQTDQTGSTLDIYYTSPNDANWFTRFHNVFFTEVSQTASQAGADGGAEPLYEIYQLIASRKEIIRYT